VNESSLRIKKFQKQLNESVSKAKRLNSVSRKARVEALTLRKKLAESNLNNVKLAFANKVLQNTSLNRQQKAKVIRRLDECVSSNEAKKVYQVVANRIAQSKKQSVNEGVGSTSSRPVRKSGVSNLNEGTMIEAARWAKLAGL
jgi:hypothetical protein